MSTNNTFTDDLLTAEELAKKLNVSVQFIHKHTRQFRIPGQIKVGRVWRYRESIIFKRLLGHYQFLLEESK